jgi:hypothetical protein
MRLLDMEHYGKISFRVGELWGCRIKVNNERIGISHLDRKQGSFVYRYVCLE